MELVKGRPSPWQQLGQHPRAHIHAPHLGCSWDCIPERTSTPSSRAGPALHGIFREACMQRHTEASVQPEGKAPSLQHHHQDTTTAGAITVEQASLLLGRRLHHSFWPPASLLMAACITPYGRLHHSFWGAACMRQRHCCRLTGFAPTPVSWPARCRRQRSGPKPFTFCALVRAPGTQPGGLGGTC